MASSEWSEVIERLEKLEKQNRRIKQVGTVVLFLAVAVLVMGQAPPKRTVEANEFILQDTNGKLGAKLAMLPGFSTLALYDENARERVYMLASPFGGSLSLFGGDRDARVTVSTLLGRPTLTIVDEEGFETTIGTSDLISTGTGETHKTSAASVVMFDKDKKVIWKAP